MKFEDIYDSARPYIASFVILRRGNKIAMIVRKNTGWMDGFYALPAGKVEYNETILEAAAREASEEAGVVVEPKELKAVHTAHRHGMQGKGFMDWVDTYFESTVWQGEPHNAEPLKSEKLEWVDINNLPKNVVPPQLDALKRIAKGEIYSEFGW